jgi:UDP-glucose 4-epimerase
MLNVIKDMPKKPVILFSSSASVYGEPESWPVTEDSVLKPISPYGRTKFMIEKILQDYFIGYGISSICFRYFNAAGAELVNHDLGQAPGATHIVARALEASLTGKVFTINGGHYPTSDGTCVRDYIHVWDLANAHLQAASFLLDDYPQSGSYAFNLGTETGISNREIVEYIKKKYGIRYQIGPKRDGDPAELVASAALAKEVLGWKPQHSDLDTIVDSAYKWYTR